MFPNENKNVVILQRYKFVIHTILLLLVRAPWHFENHKPILPNHKRRFSCCGEALAHVLLLLMSSAEAPLSVFHSYSWDRSDK